MHLLLIRHGQSYVNLEDWEGGLVDTRLTPLGRQQSTHLADWLAARVMLDALYSSTMARALETAEIVTGATGIVAQTDDRLREFGYCYADGSMVGPEAMPIQYAEFWGSNQPYTQISSTGESWLLFRARVGGFLDEVVARHATDGDALPTVAVICHGGVIDAAFDYVFNVGAQRRVEIWTPNTGIAHWEFRPQSGREPWRLRAHGQILHLIGTGEDVASS